MKEYSIQRVNGDFGQVDGFAFNLDTCDLEYIIANKSKWFLQSEVYLLPTSFLEQPDNRNQIISTRLNTDTIDLKLELELVLESPYALG